MHKDIIVGQGHQMTFVQGHADLIIFKLSFCSKAFGPTEIISCGAGDQNLSEGLRSHDQDGHHDHVW